MVPTETRVDAEIRNYLTETAAQHLAASGLFALPFDPSEPERVSPEAAQQLAVAFVRTWGQSHQPAWTYQRGSSFDLRALQLSPRVFLAETPFERVQDGVHPAFVRLHGPWYIVHFDIAGEPVLGVAVSAYSSDLTIKNGVVIPPVEGGTFFYSRAVSQGSHHPAPYRPLTPEEAVVRVASLTGAKIAGPPELVRRGAVWHPLVSLWKLPLDRSVAIQIIPSSGTDPPVRRRVQTLYLSPDREMFAAAEEQPTAIAVEARASGTGPEEVVQTTVSVRSGGVVNFQKVAQVGEQ